MLRRSMNFTREILLEVVKEEEYKDLQDLLMIESTVVWISFYSGFVIFLVNLLIFLFSCLLYWNPHTRRPSLIFIANLALCDTCLSLSASLTSKHWLQEFKHQDEYSTEVAGKMVNSDRDKQCRIAMSMFIFSMGNTLYGLAILTLDRYISIKWPLKYPIIMNIRRALQMIAVNWVFWFAFGTITYSTLNLRYNHVCTYAFSIPSEFQLVLLLLQYLVLAGICLVYRKILKEFYKKKKYLKNLEEEYSKYQQCNSISFHSTKIFVIPVKIEKDYQIEDTQKGIHLQSIKHKGENGKVVKLYRSEYKRRRSSLSKSLSFHIKYVSSSRYVLVILIAFWIFHAPLFFLVTLELGRLYTGYYDSVHLSSCSREGTVLDEFHWFEVQDYYIGDCVRLMVTVEEDDLPDCLLPSHVNFTSSQFCHTVHQSIDEIKTLSRTVITYRVGVFNTAVNPVLYAVWYRHFREGVLGIIRK